MIRAVASTAGKLSFPQSQLLQEASILNPHAGMLTSGDDNPNCYSVKDHGKFSNFGDFIRVNLPDKNGKRNYMHVNFSGVDEQLYGNFSCCLTLDKVDEGIDKLGDAFRKQFNFPPRKRTRVSRCCIDGMKTCENCGSKCNTCDAHCPKI
jgi:hypothetical protein